jgi:NADH-quinone oxidoreductase subunit L
VIIVAVAGSRRLKAASHWPVIAGVGGAAVLSFLLLNAVRHLDQAAYTNTYTIYDWIAPAANVWFTVSFYVDPLTAVMLVTVCTVATFVMIYSRDYMREHGHPERGYERFFAFMALFVFSMCVLVLAGNFLLLFVGWEAVGLCSYLLIGFYYPRPSAAAAAKKAFIVNRIGDFGFLLGILFIYRWIAPHALPGEDPLDYGVVFHYVSFLEGWQCTTIALLLFCGAVGKSAQMPLYVWLPDAMEGPSPVSALIHAATMVTAGVYMVARCGPIFYRSPGAMAVVASVGAVTAFFAATIALAQYDMKRILAYSTISQLGYMFLGLGAASADAAIFHLFTHAFFKALLFLGAGSVMHAMAGVIDMRQFSGLRRVMPKTYWTFLVGGLALAGFPLFSGFFSKDEIIHAAFMLHPILGVIGLLTALLTAFYTFRMIFVAFHGPLHVPEGVKAHESGRWMWIPLVVLAIGAAFGGLVGIRPEVGGFLGFIGPGGVWHKFLDPVFASSYGSLPIAEEAHGEGSYWLMYVSALLAIVGVGIAHLLFVRMRQWTADAVLSAPDVFQMLHDKYYIDELYELVIVRPLRRLGAFFFAVDNYFIDGLLWFVTLVPRTFGFVMRSLQGGMLQGYGLTMSAGLIVILVILLLAR